MTNIDKYKQAFIESFNVDESQLFTLNYQDISEWDSVGHMGLIALLEEYFQIMMDAEDIVDFSSYKKGLKILIKYDVEF